MAQRKKSFGTIAPSEKMIFYPETPTKITAKRTAEGISKAVENFGKSLIPSEH